MMIPKSRTSVYPSEVLREEFNGHLVDDPVIRSFIIDHRDVTPITAALLAGRFGTSIEFWMNLQDNYDRSVQRQVEKVIK